MRLKKADIDVSPSENLSVVILKKIYPMKKASNIDLVEKLNKLFIVINESNFYIQDYYHGQTELFLIFKIFDS